MLAWTLLGVAALVSSALVHLQLPIARDVARDETNAFVSREISGRLAIGRIDRLWPGHIVARHVAFYDARERRVAVADRVTLAIDLRAALENGTLRFSRARLEGGVVRLVDQGSGLPTLIEAFAPADPTPSRGEPLHTVVDNIELRDVTLYGELLGLEDLRVEELSARGRIEVADTLEIDVSDASGRIVRPFPFEGRLERLAAHISSDPQRGVTLSARVRRDDEHARAQLSYRQPAPPDEPQLDLTIRADPVRARTLEGLGFEWAEPLAGRLRGKVRLHGPPGALALEADVESEGGRATIEGLISDTEGVSVALESEGLELARVADDAPAIRVAGSARIDTGATDDAATRVTLELDPTLYEGVAVPSLSVAGRLEEDRFVIDRVRTSRMRGQVHGSGDIDFDGRANLKLRANIPDIGADARLRRLFPGARGSLQGEMHIVTPGEERPWLDFHGRIVLTHFRYGALSARRLVIAGRARGDPDLPAVNLRIDGRAVAIADYAVGDPEFRLTGGPRRYRAVGKLRMAGRQTFDLDARIQADRRGFTLDAPQIRLAVGQRAWRGMIRALRVDYDRAVRLELLRLADRSQRLEVNGIVRFEGPDELRAQLQDFDITLLASLLGPDFPIERGRADTHLELRGDVRRPKLVLQGALRQAAVAGFEPVQALYFLTFDDGQLEADGEIDGGDLGVVSFNGTGQLQATTLQGLLSAVETGSYRAEIKASELSFEVLERLADTELDVSGHVSGTVATTGTPQNPALDGQLVFGEVRYRDWPELQVATDFDYREDRLRANLELSDANGPLVSLDASLPVRPIQLDAPVTELAQHALEGEWSLDAETPARRLDSLGWPRIPSWPAQAAVQLSASRTDEGVRAELRLDADWLDAPPDSPCAQLARPSFSGRASLAGGRTTYSVTALLGGGQLNLQGESETPVERWIRAGRWQTPRGLSLDGRLVVLDLAKMPWLCEYGRGRLNAEFDVRDVLTPSPSGHLRLRSRLLPRVTRDVGNQRQTIASCAGDPLALGTEVRLDASSLTIDGHMSGCHGGPAKVLANVPLVWSAQLIPGVDDERTARLSASFENAQLRALVDRIPGILSGQALANGAVSARGQGDDVRYTGNLGIREGTLRIASTGQTLTGIQGGVDFQGARADLRGWSAETDGGRVLVNGWLGFEGWVPRQIRLLTRFDDVPVRREGSVLATHDGSASIEGEIDEDATALDLRFERLEVTLPDQMTRTLQPLDPHPDVHMAGTTRDTVQTEAPRTLRIHVGTEQPFWVRRSDFALLLRPKLDIIYREPDLIIDGRIDLLEGTFEQLGKEFELRQGTLVFQQTADFNPEVNLIAVHNPRAATTSPVTVTVTGTLDEMDIEFSSDCPGDAGAVSLLLTGRCATGSFAQFRDPQQAEEEFAGGLAGVLAGAGTFVARDWVGGAFLRNFACEGVGRGTGAATRCRTGISADALIPEFLRDVVVGAYIEGGVTVREQNQQDSTGTIADLVIELYFPHNLVGTTAISPRNWGADLIWEP